MMKKLILSLCCGLLAALTFSSYSSGPGTAAGLERTGVTGSGGCGGTGCHGTTSSPSAPAAGLIVLDATTMTPVTFYTPLHSYIFRIVASNSTSSILPKFGYQLTASIGTSSSAAGLLMAGTGSHTVTASGIPLVEHSAPLAGTGSGGSGTTYQVDVYWWAPPAGTGFVTVRAILNAVNNNGVADAGDLWPSGSGAPFTLPEGPSDIAGTSSVCVGSTTTLSATPAGGIWSSTTTSVATVSSSGVVTGVSAGTSTISYNTGIGYSTTIVTVNPSPAAISGTAVVCPGGVTTLTDATPGGTWSSSSATIATVGAATGIVTGVATGSAIITYTLAGGCYDTIAFSVSDVPPISGPATICLGAPDPTFTHTVPGGTWSSSTPSVATIGATSGIVSGISAGTATITYTLGSSGCYAIKVIAVVANPVASITGSSSVCATYTITLTGSPAGGTWTSLDATKATVDASTGVVTGVAAGTVSIKYKVTNSCGTDSATKLVTVTPASPCVSGVTNPFAQTNDLKVFPNPNKGSFSLNVLATVDEEAHVIFTNIVGAKVREFTIKTNEVNNVVLNQPAGTYFLSATTLSSKYFVKIVIE